MPKMKPNKGLLKRIRFTKTGKVKFRRAFGRHKRSHKSGTLLQSYRKPAFVKTSDIKRIRMMLGMAVIPAGKKVPKDESSD